METSLGGRVVEMRSGSSTATGRPRSRRRRYAALVRALAAIRDPAARSATASLVVRSGSFRLEGVND